MKVTAQEARARLYVLLFNLRVALGYKMFLLTAATRVKQQAYKTIERRNVL